MTGARITILPPGMDHRPVHSRMVCVVGPIPAAALAVQLIGSQAGLFDDDVQARAEIAIASESGQCNDPGVRMVIEGSLVGQLFGWRGKRVQQVRSVAGVRRIQVLSVEESRQEGALYGERVVLLLGKRDACRRAHQLLCCVLAADPVELERREEKEKMAAKAARVYAAQQRFLLQQQQQLVGQGVGVGGNDGNVLPLPFHQQRWDASATAAPAGPVPTTTTNNGGSSTAHQPFPMAPAFVLPTPAAHHAPSPAASSSTTHLIDPQQQHHLTVLARMEAVAVATAAGAPSPSPYTATAAATDDDAPSVAAGVLGHDRRGSTDRPLASSSPTPLQPTTTANNYTTSSSSFQKAQQGEGEEEAAALAAAAAALAVSGAGVLDAVGGCDSFPSAACQQQQLLELQQEGVPMLSFAPYASSSSSSSLNDEPMPMGEFSTEVVIHISNDNVGRLIGKEGSIVRRIRQESQCHIQIDNCPPTRVHTMRCVRIRGHIAQTHVAMALVLRQLMAGDMCTGGGDNVGGGTGRVGSTSAGLGTLGDGGPALM